MTITTYLPLKKFHIVPLTELDPNSIKEAAKNTLHDREEIKHNSKLNAISVSLGVSGGFANYEAYFNETILPFMKSNGLKKRKNLLKHSYPGDYNIFSEFKRQHVSERLFYSGKSIPKKLFTGHNFDFSIAHSWHSYDVRLILKQTSELGFVKEIFKQFEYENHAFMDYNFFLKAVESIEKYALEIVSFSMNGKKISCYFIDIIILAHYRTHFSNSFFHLLSNVITSEEDPEIILRSYIHENIDPEEKKKLLINLEREARLVTIFKNRLSLSDKGWVYVKPLNNNIIFIHDLDGNYDYFIKNQRDDKFYHQIFGDYLKRSQIPTFIENYRFLRWHYFEYQGWRELDSHLSESFYYKSGNLLGNYPGSDAILQRFFISKGVYQPLESKYGNELSGFHKVELGGKVLMISDLITIEDFMFFAAANSDYMNYRKGDNWFSVNADENKNLPASVSFYDTLAYINWIEVKSKIPFRLLSLSEYKELTGRKMSPYGNRTFKSDLRFYETNGFKYDTHPPYMSEAAFQNLQLKFDPAPKMFSKNGLSFVESDSFCEWLLEECQIRSKSHLSFYFDEFIERSTGPLYSTGKYKGLKTGFRICYELK